MNLSTYRYTNCSASVVFIRCDCKFSISPPHIDIRNNRLSYCGNSQHLVKGSTSICGYQLACKTTRVVFGTGDRCHIFQSGSSTLLIDLHTVTLTDKPTSIVPGLNGQCGV